MKFLWSTTFVGLAATIQAVNAIPAPPSLPTSESGGQFMNVSRSQAHVNAMANLPAGRIVHSDTLNEYFTQYPDANYTIYLSDQRAFVDLTSVNTSAHTTGKRESGGCISDYIYTKTYTKQTGSWWDAWHPASSCFWTGDSNAGGSMGLSYSTSLSITESAGLDWNIIKDILSANLGLSVTETWTESLTHTCSVLAYSVVQVWAQQYLAWGWFWSQDCHSNSACGGCGDEYVRGGATAPATNPLNFQHVALGCSTGTDKVPIQNM